jgi:cell division protein FtsI (penicillin-binding protein 3)
MHALNAAASQKNTQGLNPLGGRSDAFGVSRARGRIVTLVMALAFAIVGAQLTRLASSASSRLSASASSPIAQSFSRPDIVDRNGRLLANDLMMPSLFADPSIVLDRDETAEKLVGVLPEFSASQVRRLLEDRRRRFVWLRRGLSPGVAQAVHDLGLPGLAFRDELKRAYPLGNLAGYVLGHVNVDNKGMAGIERHIDDSIGVEAVHGATLSGRVAVRLSLDIGVQHSLEDELATAVRRFRARAAAGLVMDVRTGEMLAAASLPSVNPLQPGVARDEETFDRVAGGVFELGSVFKLVTLALALEGGKTSLDTIVDVMEPLSAGKFTIKDSHPLGRPMTVAEVFIHSSNVGAGLLALEAGAERQAEFLKALGLMGPLRTEQGPVAAPITPKRFERAEQITVSYGHGLAVAPIQFAAAAASLINGGHLVKPTFLRRSDGERPDGPRVVSDETSAKLRQLLRRNVTDPAGTGKRAKVAAYQVGGKTGTAEIPSRGGYSDKAVLSSFLAAFPMDAPKYLVLVSLFEPSGTGETRGEVFAGMNAAPTAGRVIARIAPLLGVLPATDLAAVN